MPSYAWMVDRKIDNADTVVKIKAMKTLGVPYDTATVSSAGELAMQQGESIAANLKKSGDIDIAPDSEMVALIAYLQRLGKHPEPAKTEGK